MTPSRLRQAAAWTWAHKKKLAAASGLVLGLACRYTTTLREPCEVATKVLAILAG